MKYGINCSLMLGPCPSTDDVFKFAKKAEKLGFSSIVLGDHVVMPDAIDQSTYPGEAFDPKTPWFDSFVFLAAIAGVTEKIRLATGVTVVPYRAPVQQAKAVATLDFISGGRFSYGVGVGWMREEFEALGVPFAERAQRTDEYIQVMKLLWSGTGEAFHGKFVNFPGGFINPLPAQKPHPPIIVGGDTSPALRRVARYGDGFLIFWKTLPEFKRVLEEIASNMADSGRKISDLYKQMTLPKIETLLAHKDDLPDYEALGLNEIVYVPRTTSASDGFDAMEKFAGEFIECASQ